MDPPGGCICGHGDFASTWGTCLRQICHLPYIYLTPTCLNPAGSTSPDMRLRKVRDPEGTGPSGLCYTENADITLPAISHPAIKPPTKPSFRQGGLVQV